MIGRVMDNLYIGDTAGICDTALVPKITYIVYLADGDMPVISGSEIKRQTLFNIELMSSEFQQVSHKLNVICDMISDAISRAHVVGIVCNDGKNVSALIAGSYLIKYAGVTPTTAINKLESTYHTVEQREAIQSGLELRPRYELSKDNLALVDRITATRCLTNRSFRKLLHL